MIPNFAGRQIIPVLPSLAAEGEVPKFAILLSPSDAESRERVREALSRAYGGDGRVKGNAFCVKVGSRIYACNPWENWDKGSWFEAVLEEPFSRLKAEMPVHSSLVGVQEGGVLMLHVNGRRERRTRMRVEAKVPLKVVIRPREAGNVEFGREGKVASISVSHREGWCDVVISASEKGSKRF